MGEEGEFGYTSPGPKGRVEGVWMPKEKYEALESHIAQLKEALRPIIEMLPNDNPYYYTASVYVPIHLLEQAQAVLCMEPSEAPAKLEKEEG